MKLFLALLIGLSGFLYLLSTPNSVYATEAGLTCTPTSGTYSIGDNIVVDLVLNTRSFPVYGASIVSTYSTTFADVVGLASPVTSVTNWSTPTTNAVDATLGKITLDYGSAQAAFTGNTAIGRVTFKAKAAGQLEVGYTFFQQYDDTTPGVTKVWGKKDGTTLSNILTDVSSCIYNITATAPTATPGPSATAAPTTAASTPVPTVSIAELPRTGATENMIILTGVAAGLIILGGLLPTIASVIKR